MIRNIGSAKKPVGPREGDLTAALQLLAGLGSNPNGEKVLKEWLAAIQHNEKLLQSIHDLRAQLPDLERREREVAEVEARADKKLADIQRVKDSFQTYEKDLKQGTL